MNLNHSETSERDLGRTGDIKQRKFGLCNIFFFPHLLKGENQSLEKFRIGKDQFA